jgi:cold shock CspA family protein
MYGQITKFRDDIGVGVIEAEDGRKYRFVKTEIVNRADGLIGQGVDFLVDASRPRQIIMMAGSPWTAFGGLALRAANDRE